MLRLALTLGPTGNKAILTAAASASGSRSGSLCAIVASRVGADVSDRTKLAKYVRGVRLPLGTESASACAGHSALPHLAHPVAGSVAVAVAVAGDGAALIQGEANERVKAAKYA
eukprot:6175354-Pleurochrysis_carterae.AAC.3